MITKLKLERVSRNWNMEKTAIELKLSRACYWLMEHGRINPSKRITSSLFSVVPIQNVTACTYRNEGGSNDELHQ